MLISEAFAQTAAPAADGLSGLSSMLPLLLIFVIFYFLLIRPQQKRVKEHKAILSQLRRGDKVVTGGGIIGQVVKVQDNEVTVEIAENVKIKVVQDTISAVVSRGEPVPGKGANDGEAPKPEGESKSGSMLGKLLSGKKD
ncbi:MAG: preprotein translocase subunit YajC [Alphaproteobacteria bacterium]|nr:preprotein translocase subunit YajC [Alphaproteobacteria bacterium]